MSIKLQSNRWRVVLATGTDVDDESAWVELVVQTRSADQLAAEALFRRKKWALSEEPIRFSHVSAFYALRRTGALPPTTSWEEFEAHVLEVTAPDGEDGVVTATPTQPGPEPG